ncbi:MAG: hypothetical protein J6Z01_12435 [Bacteroidales bacterium]|nr:hypothetical protein [Bacteroidales bacterium]
MMKLKKQDINFLKLFTLYQISELVICFIFNHCIYLAYFRPVNGEIVDLEWTTWHFMYGHGLGIQYGIVVAIWFISVLFDCKYLKIIKIVLYCSIDMIIPLAIPMLFFIGFPYISGFAHFVYWLFGFSLLIICSKVLFFKYYKKRFSSPKEHPNTKTINKDDIADSDILTK